MTRFSTITRNGRRPNAGRHLVAAVVSVCVALPGAHLAAAADPAPTQEVSVREERGTYAVRARFEVPQPPEIVLAVLSDYEQIPRFLPDVKTSVVLERSPGRLLVEQQAVSKFMMFSKDVHLVLDIAETDNRLDFVDRCGKSFRTYTGSWRLEPKGSGTVVTYDLTAQPGFDVPEFILKRLLKRDAINQISRLRTEFAARAARAKLE